MSDFNKEQRDRVFAASKLLDTLQQRREKAEADIRQQIENLKGLTGGAVSGKNYQETKEQLRGLYGEWAEKYGLAEP